MKKRILMFIIAIVLVIISIIIALYSNKNNLIKLNYNEIIEKVDNKENFVLCVSASYCSHCQDYKPKLKKITNEYNIIIYYVDIDKFTEEEYENFKRDFSFDGSTPTTIFFKEGKEKTTATRIEGNASIEKIITKLKANGYIN